MIKRTSQVECSFFFQAEDGIRDLVRSRGLGDVYKRQIHQIQAREVVLGRDLLGAQMLFDRERKVGAALNLSLIHI